jgi:hypothetical protein
VALVADFVADYSCEGSGGIAPLFPLPLAHRVIKELQRARSTLQSFTLQKNPISTAVADFHRLPSSVVHG